MANTAHQFSPLDEGFRMVVTAVRDIKKGEEITHSYVEPQEPLLVRQVGNTRHQNTTIYLLIFRIV